MKRAIKPASWSVIIPSGRPERVAETLHSLKKLRIADLCCETIVVTPAAEVPSTGVFQGVEVILTDRLFAPGKMRNIGAQTAHGDYFLFLDDDCLAPPNLVEDMTLVLQTEDDVGAVGCRVVASEASFWNCCADHALFTVYQAKKAGITGGLGSAALAVRRKAFFETGGFDEELLASEDWDFSLKLREKGWLCWFTPDIEVRHDHRRGSFTAILQAAWKYGRASGLTVQQRHEGTISWIARIMIAAARSRMYWLLILPYSCFLTLVWLVETRPVKVLPCLPILFLARLSYQRGVLMALRDGSRRSSG